MYVSLPGVINLHINIWTWIILWWGWGWDTVLHIVGCTA